MKKILIIGAGGLAREFTSWFSGLYNIVGYLSDNDKEHLQYKLPGTWYNSDVTPSSIGTDLAVVAISAPLVKAKFYRELCKVGFKFPSFIHPSSIVSESATMHEGVVVSPNCVISPNVTINKLAYINFCCGIGHDVIVGKYTQINPGVELGGYSVIGDYVLVGSNASILQGISVGDGATIGSGAVVFVNVSERVSMMGNPARRLPFSPLLDASESQSTTSRTGE